jgi:hypothetical protein
MGRGGNGVRVSEMTPGQAACVAWNAHYAEEHGIEARNEWAASDPRGRAAWEAAAKAGAAAVTAERDKLRELLGRYERITTAYTRGMYMARIDCMRGDVKAAVDCLSEGLDGWDGTEWNGTETGAEWWERTKAEEGL